MPIRSMVLASLFAALLSISSYIYIPIGPVPHTLQVFVVLLSGLVLGSRWGGTSVLLWIMIGVFGVPVFAQGKAGAAVLLGPTGGFLFGFMVCAVIIGWITEKKQLTFTQSLLSMMIGLVVIYGIGMIGFMMSFKYFLHKPMTWEKAVSLAVVPFLPFDIIKAVGAAYVGVRVKRALAKTGLTGRSY